MEYNSNNIEETKLVAKDLVGIISKKNTENNAVVVLLYGDLGTGKTTLTKEFAKIIGITDIIISPTFVLEKVYNIQKNGIFGTRFNKLVHIDAYRISKKTDLDIIGWSDIKDDVKNIVFVEWPELVDGVAMKDAIKIKFEHKGESSRKITIQT